MRRALIVGIDAYSHSPVLSGCVNDAKEVANLLRNHEDGSPNFEVLLLTSDSRPVGVDVLQVAIGTLFDGDAEIALLYFAGHGLINPITDTGHIVAQDGRPGTWGMSLSELLALANSKAYPRIKSTIIILDCCQSGGLGELAALGANNVSAIGHGVTILAACTRSQEARELDGHGVFTSLLLECLSGSSADVCGRITPASIYSNIDQSLGAFAQRPVYKANVQSLVVLRRVDPRVPLTVLRDLPRIFAEPSSIHPLDPSCERDRGEEKARLVDIKIDLEKERIYKRMQQCNRQGLVVPVDQPNMWDAAINSTGCKLTSLGKHYRELALANYI
jgi:caspase domain-containing protein